MRQLKISKQITKRETQSLDKYLQEIAKVGLIASDAEIASIYLDRNDSCRKQES